MSEATSLLASGLGELLTQHGSDFTVDGVDGEFSGVCESPIDGTILSDMGMREEASMTLTFSTDAGWTPQVGQRVNAKSSVWVVTSIRRENASFVVSLIGRHQ